MNHRQPLFVMGSNISLTVPWKTKRPTTSGNVNIRRNKHVNSTVPPITQQQKPSNQSLESFQLIQTFTPISTTTSTVPEVQPPLSKRVSLMVSKSGSDSDKTTTKKNKLSSSECSSSVGNTSLEDQKLRKSEPPKRQTGSFIWKARKWFRRFYTRPRSILQIPHLNLPRFLPPLSLLMR